MFSCNICNFESNDPNNIKNHLAEHAISPKIVSTNIPVSKEQFKALLKNKDWHDAYDEHGNPWYETTDSEQNEQSENSSDDE